MRGRGKFVRFLEYVSIPLSLAGSGFGGRHAGRDASSSSSNKSGIATEKQNPDHGDARSGSVPLLGQLGAEPASTCTRRILKTPCTP